MITRRTVFRLPLLAAAPALLADGPSVSRAVIRAAERHGAHLVRRALARTATAQDVREMAYALEIMFDHLDETRMAEQIDRQIAHTDIAMTVQQAVDLRALIATTGFTIDDTAVSRLQRPIPAVIQEHYRQGVSYHGRETAKLLLDFADLTDRQRGGFIADNRRALFIPVRGFWDDNTCWGVGVASTYLGIVALAAGPAGPGIGLFSLGMTLVAYLLCD